MEIEILPIIEGFAFFFIWYEIESRRVSDGEKQSIDENSHHFFAHKIQILSWIIYLCWKERVETWRKFNLHSLSFNYHFRNLKKAELKLNWRYF